MSVLLEQREHGIALLRIDRPEKRNALDTATIEAFLGRLAELADLADGGDLRAVVLSTTSIRALCAGADVTEELDHEGGVTRMDAFTRLYAAWDGCPVPTIAVCVGDVLGAGAELAAGADLRVGGLNLRTGWVGARLGVPVGPARLVPLVGFAKATELLLTARTLDAHAADELGLLTRVTGAEAAEAAALELAAEIAAHPPEGVRQMKRLLRRGEGTAERIERENAVLLYWQRHGAGLPRGGAPG